MEIIGKIIEISAVKQITEAFKKREFVIEYSEGGKYMEYIKFELAQDKVSLMDEFNEGDTIEVAFNLRGRAWEKNGEKTYFNSLQAWKIKKVANGDSNQVNASNNNAAPTSANQNAEPVSEVKTFTTANEDDDLPF